MLNFLKERLFPQKMKVQRQPKQIMQNVLNKDLIRVALLQVQTILFKDVDVSEYMDPALLTM